MSDFAARIVKCIRMHVCAETAAAAHLRQQQWQLRFLHGPAPQRLPAASAEPRCAAPAPAPASGQSPAPAPASAPPAWPPAPLLPAQMQ